MSEDRAYGARGCCGKTKFGGKDGYCDEPWTGLAGHKTWCDAHNPDKIKDIKRNEQGRKGR